MAWRRSCRCPSLEFNLMVTEMLVELVMNSLTVRVSMMERIMLGVLCLTGWYVASCLARQYHFVADPMTWTKAQKYCRKMYTDLATVENAEEMEEVKTTVLSSSFSSEFWIGMYSNINWKWSDGYTGRGADFRTWETSKEPDFRYANQYCVDIHDGGWWDDRCYLEYPFICYGGSQQDPEFVYVNQRLTWSSAQKHCRENYIDLATVRNDTENQRTQNLVASGDWVWIGLFRDPENNWSDGSDSEFTYWEGLSNPLGHRTVLCVAADLQTEGKWRLHPCETKHPFVCYGSPTAPVNRQVIKLKMKPDDPSVDLNDPAVKADILKKLQDRLKENGLSGVSLKWKEQPDGKVFHKEGTSTQRKRRERSDL